MGEGKGGIGDDGVGTGVSMWMDDGVIPRMGAVGEANLSERGAASSFGTQ